jgi:hypothetical protein
MINPLDFYKTYTTYDGVRLAFISLLIIGGVMLHAYIYTRSKKVQIVNVFSWLAMEIIFMSSILVVKNLFEVQITIMTQTIYFGILFLQGLNLMLLTDIFSSEKKSKNADIDHVSRKHFTFTVNFSVLIALLVSAGAIFMNIEYLWIILTLGLDAIILLGVTHLFVRKQLQEPFEMKLKKVKTQKKGNDSRSLQKKKTKSKK